MEQWGRKHRWLIAQVLRCPKGRVPHTIMVRRWERWLREAGLE